MDTLHQGMSMMSTRFFGSARCDSHGIHIIGGNFSHVESRWPIRKYGWTINSPFFKGYSIWTKNEPVCLPNEFWWGIWNLTSRVQGRCPAAVREVKHLTTNQCLEGAGIQWFSPWFNSFLWKIARYHTRHRTWRNIRWHRPECWRCHVRCPHSMYLICLLSRVGSITVNNLNVSKDGHGILMYFGGMGLTPLGWWDSKMGWFLQNSMGSTPIAILLLPDRIQADKANSTWPVRICISHVLLWAPSCLCLCHACRRIVGCRALASACQAGGIGLAADVDVDAAALVVVLPRRNKKAQPKEQTSW